MDESSSMIITTTNILLPEDKPDAEAQRTVGESTFESELSNNVTCQVEININTNIKTNTNKDDGTTSSFAVVWKLFSLDESGQRKTSGGDEFYIRYEEFGEPMIGADKDNDNDDDNNPLLQAVAIITDHNDGSYSLDFATTPMNPSLPSGMEDSTTNKNSSNTTNNNSNRRVLTVHLEYSNDIGRMPPPTKHEWKNGGYTHKVYTSSECPIRPPVRAFCPPTANNHNDDDTPSMVDLGSFDRVFAFGDSTMSQFVRQRPNKKGKYYFEPSLLVGEKLTNGLNSQTLEMMMDLLEKEFGEQLTFTSTSNPDKDKDEDKNDTVALIVGSCLWDVLDAEDTLQGRHYLDHIQACRNYVERLRQRYPRVVIFWKSPMAVHIHWVDLERVVEHDKATATLFGVNRIRYMSASRSRYLYECQLKLMDELKVPVLDLYEATYLSADQLYPSDGRHYRPDLNRLMLSWFYPTSNKTGYFTNTLSSSTGSTGCG